MTVIDLLDYASVLVFALTGALAASRAQLDIVGFAFLASLTAVGGGTLRNVILDRNPVFWVAQPALIAVAVAACAAVTFGLRSGSLLFGWRLPVYRVRPPRR